MRASCFVQRGREKLHFSNGQVSEEILENPPPGECPSDVLVVPESPNGFYLPRDC